MFLEAHPIAEAGHAAIRDAVAVPLISTFRLEVSSVWQLCAASVDTLLNFALQLVV